MAHRACQSVVLLVGLLAGLASSVVCQTAKLSAEELVAKHLQSIGKSVAPAGSTRVFEGRVVFSEIIGKSVRVEGASTVLSQDRKFKCAFQFGSPQYPGEQFVFDGQKIMVSMIDATSRSTLGTFLYNQEDILREGLFGGTVSTGWALLDVAKSGSKLKSQGMRKVDGRQLHDLLYVPKKRRGLGEMVIHLYFEPETYRHVMTSYLVTVRNVSGLTTDGSDETRQTMEERFDDFQETDGMTLPRHWTVRYRVTPQTKTQELQWESKFQSVRTLPAN